MLVLLRTLSRPASALLLLSTLASGIALSQQPVDSSPGQKRALSHDDYDRWPSIRSTAYSADGKWFAYAVEPAVGDGYLYIQQVDGKNCFAPLALKAGKDALVGAAKQFGMAAMPLVQSSMTAI